MKAISTRYHGPTDMRGARITASDEDRNRITISYPHEFDSERAHAQAALALCRKMGWTERHHGAGLIAGGTKAGYVFVFAQSAQTYSFYPFKEDSKDADLNP